MASILIITGNEFHHWHNVLDTTNEIVRILRQPDTEIRVEYSLDVFGNPLDSYDCLILNYVDWIIAETLDKVKIENFKNFISNPKKGLVVIHFSNGLFVNSPGESGTTHKLFRKIVRRRREDSGENNRVGHEDLGYFLVTIEDDAFAKGIGDFFIFDELYYNQVGAQPIHVIASAFSATTGKKEPLVFNYRYEDGAKVLQSLLGHSVRSFDSPEYCLLLSKAITATFKKTKL